MVGSSSSSESSLDRLKALDSLPDLHAQLKEIKLLCTHSARAEMIVRWLTGKLQSDAVTPQSPEVWETLLATLRILPAERIAAVLTSSKPMKTVESVLDADKSISELLHSLSRLLGFLLELGDSPAGVGVRSVLSLPATEAAQFAGIWLQQCANLAESHPGLDKSTLSDRVDTALRLWGLRKRSSDENEAFSQHCLVPCSALLASTSLHTASAAAAKRKHDSGDNRKSQTTLESVLARHIFIPGRAAFFKARTTTGGKKQREVGSQRASFMIETLVEPLRISLTSGDSSARAPLESLPQLLEIALRSAPTPSPTQRPIEKPWIETLFSTLFDLNKTSEGELVDAQALSGMLAVLSKRSYLVQSTILTEVAMEHAGLGAASPNSIDWDLIAAVVEVDASLFKDADIARTLFDAVTKASIKLGEDSVDDKDDHVVNAMHELWRDHIVVPVMRAFARYNDFATVLELCSQQLEKDLHGTFWSVWDHLDKPIQSLLEESLTEDGIESICLAHCRTISKANDVRETKEMPKLSAAIVMLNALLGGMRSESMLEKLQAHLADTFQALIELHDAHVGVALIPALQERRSWSLLTILFELWFPRWAVGQSDNTAVVAKTSSLAPRSMLDRAVGLSSSVHPEEYGSVEDPRSAADARCFAACICTRMLAYRGKVSEDALATYTEVLNALGRAPDRLSSHAFVLYPSALSLMDATIRQSLLQNYVKGATSGPSPQAAMDSDFLKTIGSLAAAHAQSQILDDLVEAYLEHVQNQQDQSTQLASTNAELLAGWLSEVPAKTFSRPRRERILNVICGAYIGDRDVATQAMRPCLPLMLRLMELPNPTALIALEPDSVSKMAQKLDEMPDDDMKSTDIAFFEALASLIIEHCVKTKDQERSKKVLIGLSSEASKLMKAFSSNFDEMAGPARLAFVKAVFRGLEVDSIEAFKAQMPHRKSSTVKKLIKTLANAVEGSLQRPSEDVLRSLDLLQMIPSSLMTASEFDIAPLLAVLAGFLDTRLGLSGADPKAKSDAAQDGCIATEALVHCYQILGKFAPHTPNVRLVMFADELVQLPLEPHQHATVLATFERFLVMLGPSRVALVQEVLGDGSTMPAPRALLLQLSINKLEKSDFDDADSYTPTKILHSLLTLLSADRSFTTSRRILATVIDVLKTKHFTINQYNIELTLQTLHALAQRPGPGKMILHLDICTALSTLLLHHRARLQGRFHIVLKLLQTLLARLFQPLAGWDPETARHPPTTQHATALARVVKLFCEPPHPRGGGTTKSALSLIDESRREQAHVGTFIQYFLHTFCSRILHGTLGEGMRDELRPGLWAAVEAMEMAGREGGKGLSAAMTAGERAVLRGVYEEWRRFGRWRGG